MKTYFASPERTGKRQLTSEIDFVSHHPVLNGLLNIVSGLVAVINEHRQILAVNNTLLLSFGIENIEEILGLRPGEVLNCIHADDMPGGCGTGKFCPTCGAAIAIVTSMESDQPVERTCAMVTKKNGIEKNLFFSIQSCPVKFNNTKILLLFIQDISRQQEQAMIENVFFHDMNNLLAGLTGACELLASENQFQKDNLPISIFQLTKRLTQEIQIQQFLLHKGSSNFDSKFENIPIQQILDELEHVYFKHPASTDKILIFSDTDPRFIIKTDFGIILRILGNMVTNALEASENGDTVKIWLDTNGKKIIFNVWNRQTIPANYRLRIFQRNFSTKAELGRGIGTYSMKWLGEELLGGKVSFTSSNLHGTTFKFAVPVTK